MSDIKIEYIKFFDYRAFFNGEDDDYVFNLGGNSALIYGENGSGKTSLFRGVKDFVYQNDFITHNQTPRESEGYIEIGFSDETKDVFNEGGQKPSKSEILNTAKLNSFLSYKELLKTHLITDYTEDEEINLFNLLVKGVLKHYILKESKTLQKEWERISKIDRDDEIAKIHAELEKGQINEQTTKELVENFEQKTEEDFDEFKAALDELLQSVKDDVNKFLSCFRQNLKVSQFSSFIPSHSDLCDGELPEITIEIEVFSEIVSGHQNTLNEARLSAIALSIYLAAIKSNPTSSAVKLLLLDDIFLGLDSGNRIPLLEILNKEFSDWQIILTTYDKHWYEVAKKYLRKDWKFFKMYAGKTKVRAGKKEEQKFEFPIVIPSTGTPLETANNQYLARDYSACANSLRKEIERLVKERLPLELKRNFEGKPHALAYLWAQCCERYAKFSITVDKSIIDFFDVSRLVLLNPQSHHSLHHPIYKQELEKTFCLVKKISALPILKEVVMVAKGAEFVFVHPKEDYTFRFRLLEDWTLTMRDNQQSIGNPKCIVLYWEYNKQAFWNFRKDAVIPENNRTAIFERKDTLEKVLTNLERITQLSIDEKMVRSNTKISEIWILNDIYDKIRKSDESSIGFKERVWTEVKGFYEQFFDM